MCIKEVPDYLRNDLCGSVLEPTTPETTTTTTTTSTSAATSTLASTSAAPSTAKQVVDVAPKNSQLIQSNNRPSANLPNKADLVQLEVVTQKSVKQESFVLPADAKNNFLGIPLELPVEVSMFIFYSTSPA